MQYACLFQISYTLSPPASLSVTPTACLINQPLNQSISYSISNGPADKLICTYQPVTNKLSIQETSMANTWTNEWMNEWMNEWVIDESVKKKISERYPTSHLPAGSAPKKEDPNIPRSTTCSHFSPPTISSLILKHHNPCGAWMMLCQKFAINFGL